jgi:hypothetical protein
MADYASTSVLDLLEEESCGSSLESSPGKDNHPSRQCNMVHAEGVDPTGGVGDEPAHPLVQCTAKEQAAYEQERLERAKAHAVDEERTCRTSTRCERTLSGHARPRRGARQGQGGQQQDPVQRARHALLPTSKRERRYGCSDDEG